MKGILCVHISSSTSPYRSSTYRSIPIIRRVFDIHIDQICNNNRSYRNVCNMSFVPYRSFSQKDRSRVDWAQWRHKALLRGAPRLSLALAPHLLGPALCDGIRFSLLEVRSQLATDTAMVSIICKAIRRFRKTLSSTYSTMTVIRSSGRDNFKLARLGTNVSQYRISCKLLVIYSFCNSVRRAGSCRSGKRAFWFCHNV